MAEIFISYRQDDAKPWTLLLADDLADVSAQAVMSGPYSITTNTWINRNVAVMTAQK